MKLPRFRLRTLFILVAIAALPMAWVAYQLNWIRQRHEFLKQNARTHQVLDSKLIERVPWSLRLFGEESTVASLIVDSDSEVETAKKLFPESALFIVGPSDLKKVKVFIK